MEAVSKTLEAAFFVHFQEFSDRELRFKGYIILSGSGELTSDTLLVNSFSLI